MKAEPVDEDMIDEQEPPAAAERPDVSSVFMMLVRRVLEASSANGMPADADWRRLARWCELHRYELLRLSKVREDPESRQRRIWLHELASMPTGRWIDLRGQLAPLIRVFGLPPRSQNDRFLSPESQETSPVVYSSSV